MHDTQRRHRRNQSEVGQLIRDSRDSGLRSEEFSRNVGVQLQTLVHWLKTASVDLTHGPNHNADRLTASDFPTRFVAVEVRQCPLD